MSNMIGETFDDGQLLEYLRNNQIPYIIGNEGLIELQPKENALPSIVVPLPTKNVVLNSLKSCYSLDTRLATYFEANKLEIVNGYLDTQAVEIINVDSLEVVIGNFDASSASEINADKLFKTKQIWLSPAMANKETKSLFFSSKIGSIPQVSVFNKNSSLVQLNHYPWLSIETMAEIVEAIYYSGGRNYKQYTKFLSQCKEKRQNTLGCNL